MTTTAQRRALAETVDPREARLPGWVRERFALLRRAVLDAETLTDRLLHATNVEQSDAVQREGITGDKYVGLGAGLDGQVTYLLDGPGCVGAEHRQISVRVENGMLYVMASPDLLVVHPQSGNTVRLDVTERRRRR